MKFNKARLENLKNTEFLIEDCVSNEKKKILLVILIVKLLKPKLEVIVLL